ncbi:MAG: hypothetical protein V8S38_08085 [Lachnospiraceae bacterium]
MIGVLAQDPRPAYVQDPGRLYGVSFAGYDVKFQGGKRHSDGAECGKDSEKGMIMWRIP